VSFDGHFPLISGRGRLIDCGRVYSKNSNDKKHVSIFQLVAFSFTPFFAHFSLMLTYYDTTSMLFVTHSLWWRSLLLFGFSTACFAQTNQCPQVCLDVIQGNSFTQVEPIVTVGDVRNFYKYSKNDNLSFNGDDVVPLIPNHSLFMIHQDASKCGLDFVVVHDSKEDPSGGQVHMTIHDFDAEEAVIKDGNPLSNRYKYDPVTNVTEVFWEWGWPEDELSAFHTDGMGTEWQKYPAEGDCLELNARFLIGIEYWRFVPGPVGSNGRVDPNDYMYLDKDKPLKVCVGTCGKPPRDIELKPATRPTQNHKKLIVFAGPHETGGDSIVAFLSDGARNGGAMDGWLWPTIQINGATLQHPFAYFVKHQNSEDIQDAIVSGIRDAWIRSKHGIVIGADQFDKVGIDPDTGEFAITALEFLVQRLGIVNEDVTVALIHRSPRVDHWDASRKHFEAESYAEFVCSEKEQMKRWEWLDTALNPFKIANVYASMGYHVDVIDYEGTMHLGLDVAHQIACRVMSHVECVGDYVKGLEGIKMSPLSQGRVPDLSVAEQSDLEDLFLSRDCFYKYFLDNRSTFQLLHRHRTWNTCSFLHNSFYQKISDTDYLMNVIQSQVSCAAAPVDVKKLVESMMPQRRSQIVVIGGPRQTQDINIMKFFAKYASNGIGNDRSPSFSGWNWPTSDSILLYRKPPYLLFDLIVTDANDRVVQDLLLDVLRQSRSEAWHGVVIGSSSFERVGTNPASKLDPLAALKIIADGLQISPEDVTVVLNYRTPRVDHWNLVYETYFNESSYRDFLCSAIDAAEKWEFLDTIMNPLKVATEVIKDGKDVGHALACTLMDGVSCDGEWIRNINERAGGGVSSSILEDLSQEKRLQLENYFISRDCIYMYHLMGDDKFEVLHQSSLWETCQHSEQGAEDAQRKYESLADTDFFLNLLKSQVDCATGSMSDISDAFLSDQDSTGNMILVNAIIVASVTLVGLILVAMVSIFCCKRRRSIKRGRLWQGDRSEGIFGGDPALKNLQNTGSNENIIQRKNSGKSDSKDGDEAPQPVRSFPPLWAFTSLLNRSDESNEESFGDEPKESFETIEITKPARASAPKKMKTQLSSRI
jgi:hypothetical protein